jgi:hypothetical protein
MVLKSEIEKSYISQAKDLASLELGILRDDNNIIKLSKKIVLVITGIRRCGKSTLMRQLIKKIDDNVAFLNFEDPRIFNFEVSDFAKLDEIIGEENKYYFFDEIQNVDQWELYIRQLADRHKIVCITGSNASLLSKELGTRLTGRYIQVELFPFSYSEFLSFRSLKTNPSSFTTYLDQGGFPQYLEHRNEEILQQLFKDIIYRDIIVRHSIRNSDLVISIALYLISNVGKEFSYTNIKNTFKVGSVNSVIDYISWLEDSYLVFTIPKFSYSLKSVAINNKKIYAIDTAFGKANSLSFSEDSGRILENAVYLHLRRRYKQIYYFREKAECDFVIKEKNKITQAFQVCEKITPDNMGREVEGMLEALHFFLLDLGIIITLNQEDKIIKENKTVLLIPAWRWFSVE